MPMRDVRHLPIQNGTTSHRSRPDVPAAKLDDLKAQLRIDDDSEDTYLTGLLLTASEYAAGYLALSLIETELRRQYDMTSRGPQLQPVRFGRNVITLPLGPVTEVESVEVIDREGEATEIEASDYTLDTASQPARIYLHEYHTGREIAFLRIDYKAGYGASAEDVPRLIQHGILMHAAYLYEHRGDCSAATAARESGALDTYARYRVVRV